MIKKSFYIIIDSDISKFKKYHFESSKSKDLSWSDKEFKTAVNLVLSGKLHANHVYLMCNDSIMKEFHINLFKSNYYDKGTI